MDQRDDELRLRLREEEAPRPCPAPETLADALTGKTKRRRRDEIIDHLLRCEECCREVRMMAELDSGLVPLLDRTAISKGTRPAAVRPRLRRPAWAAGVLVLLAATAIWFFRLRPDRLPGDDAFRGEGGAAVEFLAPGDSLPRAPERSVFRWAPVPGAGLYVLEILDDALAPVYAGEPSPGTSASLPPGVRIGLVSERRYFAKVTALNASGKPVAYGMSAFVAE